MQKIPILIIACLVPFLMNAQSDSLTGKRLADRIYYGGGLGLGFGDVVYINVAPVVSYKAAERIHVGVTGNYTYINDKLYLGKFTMLGGSLFGRYFINRNIFGHVEPEWLHYKTETDELSLTNFYVGAGYMQYMGSRARLYIMILYNLNESVYSPYSNPSIRMGFLF